MAQITYSTKTFINENSAIPDANKVTDDDMNEIKSVVNENDGNVGDLSDLTTTIKTSIVDALNEVGYDYIVEQGTENIWTWRKWASGLAECWGNRAVTGVNLTNSSASTWYGNPVVINLPSDLFTRVDMVAGGVGQGSHSSGVIVYAVNPVVVSSNPTVYSTTQIQIDFRAHQSTANANCGAYAHVYGAWK